MGSEKRFPYLLQNILVFGLLITLELSKEIRKIEKDVVKGGPLPNVLLV